jgi:hypothetical protein
MLVKNSTINLQAIKNTEIVKNEQNIPKEDLNNQEPLNLENTSNINQTQQYKSISLNNTTSFGDKLVIKNLKKEFQNNMKDFATNDEANFRSILKQSFGDKLSTEKIDELVKKAKEGNFPVPENIKFVSPETLQGNHAAYSSDDGGTVFLSESLKDNKALLLHALTEESGHHLDNLIGGEDSQGDEGEIFSRGIQSRKPLSQEELEIARKDDDKGIIEVDGKKVEVEFIAPAIIAGAWWAGKVAAQTAVDGAIDIAIAAISGMPPPGAGAHLLNAVWNAIPGLGELDTIKKVKKLKDAIDTAVSGFNKLKNTPAGEMVLKKIDKLYKEVENAISSGNIGKAKEKLSELLHEVENAQALAKQNGIKPNGISVATVRGKILANLNLPNGNTKQGWQHISDRHITGKSPGGDLFSPGTTRSQIEKAAKEIIEKGKKVTGDLERELQTFEYKMQINGKTANYRLVVNQNTGEIHTMFPILKKR